MPFSMSAPFMLLLTLGCLPMSAGTSAKGIPEFFEETGSILKQAASGFEVLGHKVDEAFHGLSLGEVAPSRRLHEAESHEVLPPFRQKAASVVIALTEFQTSSGTMGSSTLLVIVLVLGIPLAIIFFVVLFFLNESSKAEVQQTPGPRASIRYIKSHASQTPLMTPEFSARNPTVSYEQRPMGTATSSIMGSVMSSGPMGTPQTMATPSGLGTPLASGGSTGSETILCPALVVEQSAGVTLQVNGTVTPWRQEEVAEVISMDHGKAVVVRMFISESGRDSGILMESAIRFPLAFINTASAVNSQGLKPPTKNRHVSISGSSPMRGASSSGVFAVVSMENGAPVVRQGSSSGPVMWTIEKSGRIQDQQGKEVATIRSAYPGPGMTIWVAPGADACMMLCAMVAAAKLS